MNKPLLVLMALSEWERTGSTELRYSDVEQRLGRLIKEFGPVSQTAVNQAAAYPFYHLSTDGVWSLDRPVSKPLPSMLQGVTGRLNEDVEAALGTHPSALGAVVHEILDREFPATLHEDVLAAVGLDLVEISATPVPGSSGKDQRKRSAAWRRRVLQAWDDSCAICGYDGRLAGIPVALEAAHVRWFNFGGPDLLDNGLALCSLHHKLFDRGVLGLSAQFEVQVSSEFGARGDRSREVYLLHGSRLTPRPGSPLPALAHIDWHTQQVFKAPALAA